MSGRYNNRFVRENLVIQKEIKVTRTVKLADKTLANRSSIAKFAKVFTNKIFYYTVCTNVCAVDWRNLMFKKFVLALRYKILLHKFKLLSK